MNCLRELLRNLPFKFRIFFGCLAVALIPLLFSGIFLVRIFDASLRRQSMSELAIQMTEVQEQLDQLFSSCETAAAKLVRDESAYRVMIDNTNIEVQKDLYLSLYQAVQETYSYAGFNIYDAGGMLRFTTDNNGMPENLPIHWGLLRKAARHSGVVYYRTDPYLSKNPEIVMQAAYSLESRYGARAGYVVLDFTKDSFNRLFRSSYTDQDTLILLDALGEPVYCSRPEYGETELTALLQQAQRNEANRRYLYLSSSNPDYGYQVLLQKSAQISSPAIQTMQTVSLIIALFGLGLCLFVSLALSRSISQPISQLDHAMKKVRNGDLQIRIYTNRKDELGRLSDSFNRMTRELSEHLETAVQKQKDLNETTLRLYQTQLNPHFLYNTLDTIKWSAKINQNPEIPVLAENLAQILRRSISADPFITLAEELATIRYYIEIQKIRFTGRFLYEEEIPDQLEECLVPKMLLQPLVENAILHGLDGYEHGYICIYADIREYRKEQTPPLALQDNRSAESEPETANAAIPPEILRISVTDDGCGINQEMLEWINSPSPVKRPGHLGLYNIIQILKLYYGKEYGLHAERNPEGGTTVSISLPVQRR